MWATPTILGRVGAADDAPLAPVCATHVETNIESNSICSIFMARDGGLPSAQLSSCGGKGTRQYSGRFPTFRKKRETLRCHPEEAESLACERLPTKDPCIWLGTSTKACCTVVERRFSAASVANAVPNLQNPVKPPRALHFPQLQQSEPKLNSRFVSQ